MIRFLTRNQNENCGIQWNNDGNQDVVSMMDMKTRMDANNVDKIITLILWLCQSRLTFNNLARALHKSFEHTLHVHCTDKNVGIILIIKNNAKLKTKKNLLVLLFTGTTNHVSRITSNTSQSFATSIWNLKF